MNHQKTQPMMKSMSRHKYNAPEDVLKLSWPDITSYFEHRAKEHPRELTSWRERGRALSRAEMSLKHKSDFSSKHGLAEFLEFPL